MWVEISNDIFEQSDFKELNQLYQFLSWSPKGGSIQRYNVLIRREQVSHTANFAKLKEIENDFEKLIDDAFNNFVQSSLSVKKVDYAITTNLARGFNIEEAIRFFNQPVSIVLENNKNDARFMRAVFYAFDRIGTIKEHLKNGWIQFGNAGGCDNVENFIEGELKKFEDLAARSGKDTCEYYRAMVILDSDKSYPTEPRKLNHETLIRYLEGQSGPSKEGKRDSKETGRKRAGYHFLAKRALENYLPDEAFMDKKNKLSSNRSNRELTKWVTTYLKLQPEQKDFLNISAGFPKEKDGGGNRKPLSVEILNLYRDVSRQDFDTLDTGFKLPSFKDAFSGLFEDNPHVNARTLLNRAASTNSAEFEEILDKIYKMI